MKERYIMAIYYDKLGKRVGNLRNKAGMSQDELGEKVGVNNKHISNIETGRSKPSMDTLVDIANALNVSADDLLVDSLLHSASTADSELHRLLLDCNAIEEEILTRTVKELKAILYGLGI
jgi:transcriptional regulator with XRE-family HTH domain